MLAGHYVYIKIPLSSCCRHYAICWPPLYNASVTYQSRLPPYACRSSAFIMRRCDAVFADFCCLMSRQIRHCCCHGAISPRYFDARDDVFFFFSLRLRCHAAADTATRHALAAASTDITLALCFVLPLPAIRCRAAHARHMPPYGVTTCFLLIFFHAMILGNDAILSRYAIRAIVITLLAY